MSPGLSPINRALNLVPKRAEARQAEKLGDTFVTTRGLTGEAHPPEVPDAAAARRRRWPPLVPVAAVLAVLASCSSDGGRPAGTAVDLPGAEDGVDLDDLRYSSRLGKLLVPAVGAGLQLIDPDSGQASRVGGFGTADSADEGRGLVYALDREHDALRVVDPRRRRIVASVPTRSGPDYVRYVAPRHELWVAVPDAGIEIFRAGTVKAPAPVRSGFVPVPEGAGGPEGLTVSPRRRRAYVHLEHGEVAAVDIERRVVAARWPIGCDRTHGIPAVDERRGLLLAGCADDGEVVLLDIDHGGRRLGGFSSGGGEAVLGHSPTTGHFFARGDPGEVVVTLAGSQAGLREVRRQGVPRDGHCLTADDRRHLWACSPADGAVVRLSDRP